MAETEKEDEALFDDLERESKEFDKDAEIDRKSPSPLPTL